MYLLKNKKNSWPYCRSEFSSLTFKSSDPKANTDNIYYDSIGELLTKWAGLEIKMVCQNPKVERSLIYSFEPVCKICVKVYKTVEGYKKHMAKKHKKLCCKLWHDKEEFIHQIKFYDSVEALKEHHMAIVDGVPVHPHCRYCSLVFNTMPEYLKHSKEFHHYCTVWQKKDKKNVVFGNIFSYREHIETEHSSLEDLQHLDIDTLNRQVMSRNFMLKKPQVRFILIIK